MTSAKPPLVVCNTFPDPGAGSEQGKAFSWTLALARFFKVHVYCVTSHADLCRKDPRCHDWIFHPVPFEFPTYPNAWWKEWFPEWRKLVLAAMQRDLPDIRPVGLHHPTPGSFRIFPAYQCLGIPYTLGPLGGGEVAPGKFVRSAGLPIRQQALESVRPLLNRASVSHPRSRPVLRGAEHVLVTTPESGSIVRFAGATSVSSCFPDVFEPSASLHPGQMRSKQASELKKGLRLLFSGRGLWWKSGQLAVNVLSEARRRGLPATLEMYTQGPAVDAWKAYADALGVSDEVTWPGFVPREELLEHLGNAHAFIYPTLHDSSSSALPEAYSTGLPSMTLGIGGAGTASGEGTGFNEYRPTAGQWVTAVVDQLQRWQDHPGDWLQCSENAAKHAGTFSQKAIEAVVESELVPVFL